MKKSERPHNYHHRKPRSIGGTDDQRNLSWLPVVKHRAWHTLFENMPAEEIVVEINRHYIDPDYQLTLRRKSCGG